MKTLYLNCRSGIAGDMTVAALLDLGVSHTFLLRELKKLNLKNFQIKISKVSKKGVKATKFDVIFKEEKHHRFLKEILDIIDKSKLTLQAKNTAKNIFLELGKAEADAHKIPLEKVHFHEVGAIDSIIDIVATAILIDKLNIKKVYCSRITDGSGTITFSHGTTTLPVPAVRRLLKDFPMHQIKINKELVTPTGAAIIKALAEYQELHGKILKKGYGAGTRDLHFPNVVEALLIEQPNHHDHKVLLETNIDDMNPEMYEHVIESLMKKGAADVFIQPILMKKNRIGILLKVLCSEEKKDAIIEAIFDETTTFGIRINKIDRAILDREMKDIETIYGKVPIKIGSYKGKVKSMKPEYEVLKKIADKKHIPLKKVYEAVTRKIHS